MPDVQGHRGARGLWPENTLAGFARALALGVHAVELDCGLTRDGVAVVTHDPELNPDLTRDPAGRFLSATGPAIVSLSCAELQHYDVGRLRPGSAYAARFPQQQAVDGERIPRLAEVLELVRTRGRGQVRVAVEVKTFPDRPPQLTAPPQAFAAALQRDLEATGTTGLVEIMAFDWRVLTAVQRLMPTVATVALTEQHGEDDTVGLNASKPSPWLGGLDASRFAGSVVQLVKASGALKWGPDFADLDAQRVAEAHALGLRVVPWTVNDPADMERMLAFKVDGVTTDRPDVLRSVLERRGLPVPPRMEEIV
ncbi:MAG TPA: glycerophosphodiester phosphodiesterase [Steroidobacteraceae bacterium]|nr:glycerophosphodiester phosphodiesterase [Steroidobacteraceae bacterium]